MSGVLTEWVRRFYGATNGDGKGKREGSEAALFECRACDAVYIGGDVEACAECDGPVERVPNERDLGITDGPF